MSIFVIIRFYRQIKNDGLIKTRLRSGKLRYSREIEKSFKTYFNRKILTISVLSEMLICETVRDTMWILKRLAHEYSYHHKSYTLPMPKILKQNIYSSF